MLTRLFVFSLVMSVGGTPAWGQIYLFDDAENKQVERLLEQKRDIVFRDATLRDVASLLESCGIRAHIDQRALDIVGKGADTPVSFEQNDIRLSVALAFIMREFELAWMIDRGRLIITTQEEADANLAIKVYDVRHLLGMERLEYDFDSLIELITTSVAADTWDQVGGPGTISAFDLVNSRALVVTQNQKVHDQIGRLLAALTRMSGRKPLEFPPGNMSHDWDARSPLSSPLSSPSSSTSSWPIRSTGEPTGIHVSRLRTTGR